MPFFSFQPVYYQCQQMETYTFIYERMDAKNDPQSFALQRQAYNKRPIGGSFFASIIGLSL